MGIGVSGYGVRIRDTGLETLGYGTWEHKNIGTWGHGAQPLLTAPQGPVSPRCPPSPGRWCGAAGAVGSSSAPAAASAPQELLLCPDLHQYTHYELTKLSQYHPIHSCIVPVWLRDPPQHCPMLPKYGQIYPSIPFSPHNHFQCSHYTQSLPEFPVHPVSISSPSQSLPVLPASPSAAILTFQPFPVPSVSPPSSTSLISVSNATKAPISLWDSTRITSAGDQRGQGVKGVMEVIKMGSQGLLYHRSYGHHRAAMRFWGQRDNWRENYRILVNAFGVQGSLVGYSVQLWGSGAADGI